MNGETRNKRIGVGREEGGMNGGKEGRKRGRELREARNEGWEGRECGERKGVVEGGRERRGR